MPRFIPFRALRYGSKRLDDVVAPPYDVLSEADLDDLSSRSPDNIVHVDVPRGAEDRYRRAGATLARWRAEGVLVRDETATFTIYRMGFADDFGVEREIVGVLGGLEVVDVDSGGVLPHERTTPKASTDRLELTRATATNLSPVWGLSLAAGLTAALAEPGEVLGSVLEDGIRHTVERVSDVQRIEAIAQILARDDVLIADGHHRYAISRVYRDEVRASTGRRDTAAEQTLAFVNELVADQLSVAAIHRLFTDVTEELLLETLSRFFAASTLARPTPATLTEMVAENFLVLLGTERCWRLTPRPGAFDGVRALDGLWVETALADVPATVSYQHGLDQVLRALADGRASAAILVRPVTVAQIEVTARQGELMPPKSTFFTPKLKTGLVLRPLD